MKCCAWSVVILIVVIVVICAGVVAIIIGPFDVLFGTPEAELRSTYQAELLGDDIYVATSEYEEQIWNYLYELTGNAYATAGLMGNFYCESLLIPTNLQDTYETSLGYTNTTYTEAVDAGTYSREDFINDSAGYGLVQWTASGRKAGLYDYCQEAGVSIGSIDGQLGYLEQELTGTYSDMLNELKTTTSVAKATRIVMLEFERPADQSEEAIANRQKYSEIYYNRYVNGTSAEGTLTAKQLAVITIAMNSEEYGIEHKAGYCQAWAAYVYGAAGLPIDNSASAKESGERYGVSDDFSIIPPGAAVYGYASEYGHVGIYVGNGLVYHNTGVISVDTLEDWIKRYDGFCWGWEGGSDLTIPESLDIEAGSYQLTYSDSSTGDYLDYYLHVPENATENMPLIIFLHGDGEVGKVANLENYGIIKQAKAIYGNEFPFICLMPCTREESWTSGTIPKTLKGLIDYVADDLSIDPSHIIITGASRGALGVWYMASTYGNFFSAAVPVSCAGNVVSYDVLAQVPIRAYVGDGQDRKDYGNGMSTICSIVRAKGGNAVLIELDGQEHSDMMNAPYTQELFEWMLAQ